MKPSAHGELTPGGLMSFIAAFALAYEPMKKLAKLNSSLQLGLGAAERVQDMMSQQAAITDKPNAISLDTKIPRIDIQNVEFAYDGTEETKALRNLSMKRERIWSYRVG